MVYESASPDGISGHIRFAAAIVANLTCFGRCGVHFRHFMGFLLRFRPLRRPLNQFIRVARQDSVAHCLTPNCTLKHLWIAPAKNTRTTLQPHPRHSPQKPIVTNIQREHITNTTRTHHEHIANTSRTHRVRIANTSRSHREHITITSRTHHEHITNTSRSHREHITITSRSQCDRSQNTVK